LVKRCSGTYIPNISIQLDCFAHHTNALYITLYSTQHIQLGDNQDYTHMIIYTTKKERMMKRYTYFSIYYLNLMDVDLHLCGTDVLHVYIYGVYIVIVYCC